MKPGEPIVPVLQLWDGAADKHVLAHLRTDTGITVPGSPFTLGHVGYGKYLFRDAENLAFPENVFEVHSSYIVYDDAGFSILSSVHQRAIDVWRLEAIEGLEDDILDLKDTVNTLVRVINSIPIAAEITGEILIDEDITGVVDLEVLVGEMSINDDLIGEVNIDELVGFITEEDNLNGSIPNG